MSNSFQLISNFNSGVRWATATEPPVYRVQPKTPLRLYMIPLYGLHLLSDTHRHISLAQPPPGARPVTSSEPPLSLKQHLIGLLTWMLAVDIITFPTNILISPHDPNFGVKTPLGRMLWGVLYLAKTCGGEIGAWHLHAVLGLSSGMTRPEDWPRMMNKPWMADSVNDFWGRRWHNLMTVGVLTFPLTPYATITHSG
jgi:hypothetical protein